MAQSFDIANGHAGYVNGCVQLRNGCGMMEMDNSSVPTRFTKPPRRLLLLALAVLSTALIAWADLATRSDVPMGLLYVLPAALAGTVLLRWQVVLVALALTAVAEFSDAFQWNVAFGTPRDALYFAAYVAVGLYLCELRSRRQADREHLRTVEAEMEARRDAEEQLRLLVASSSIGIVTIDESGRILQANDAAERQYAGGDAPHAEPHLAGRPLETFVPSLARVAVSRNGRRPLRTMMQCQGLRHNREPFLADVWFSTYETQSGGRMTAMVVDSSDDVRDREEANLEQMLKGSRLLVGAVSHEIRNVCAAIGLVQSNLLASTPALGTQPDFLALQQLAGALERMASVELSQVKRQATHLDLDSFFRDLRIIAAPSLRDAGIEAMWQVEAGLPQVWADHQSLLQVFLNLLRNAQQALEGAEAPEVGIEVVLKRATVEVWVTDNGPGVDRPEQLFHPFTGRSNLQPTKTGFGLYLSRAMMNSFRGDLLFRGSGRGGEGASFLIELLRVDASPGNGQDVMKEMETA